MIVVYSSISGDYDNPINDGRIYINPSEKFSTHRLNAKLPKILPHKFLPHHDYSIWVDSNIKLKVNPIDLIKIFGYPLCGVFYHPFRKTIDEEIIACKNLDNIENLNYHKNKEGVLSACGFIIRKNIPKVNELNEKWLMEILIGSSRDQLSFPYTLGKITKHIKIESKNFKDNEFFTIVPHKSKNRNQ